MIREELEPDFGKIFNVIALAFFCRAESNLVGRLISEKDILCHLIYESSGVILGNVVVSRVTLEPDRGLFCGGVAPLSVLPKCQFSGIGSKLMKAAIKNSEDIGLDALFLLGDPNYYKNFDLKLSNLVSDYSAEYIQEPELTKICLANVKSKVIYANAFKRL